MHSLVSMRLWGFFYKTLSEKLKCSLSWYYKKSPLSVTENSIITHQTAASLARLFEHQAHTTAKRKKKKPAVICFNVLLWGQCTNIQYLTRCNVLFYIYVFERCAGVHEYPCQHRLFFSFILLQRSNHISALSWWHIVKKQFPVCKCPVYTFLLQSLSLYRLLEYEENSYIMKNENGRTSVKKKIYCAYSRL